MIKNYRYILAKFLYSIFSLFPLQKKIVFSSFDGKNYGDNPKALFLKLEQKYGKNFSYVWLMYDSKVEIPNAKVVKAYSINGLYELATSKVWIHNSRLRSWLHKRSNQFYIQTWHGNVALKKIERDAQNSLPELYIKSAKNDSRMADLMISGSRWNTQNIRNSFWYNGDILECGLPKSDVFFNDTNSTKEKVNISFSLLDSDNVLLYCPTFRSDFSSDKYISEFSKISEKLSLKFGGRWKIMVRLHPNFMDKNNSYLKNMDVIDATNYPDVNDLILRANTIITDYSSIMFDALLVGNKVFLYCPDIPEYLEDRGTYFDFDSLPFPISTKIDDLLSNIEIYNEKKYYSIQNKFKNKLEMFDNGSATEKVIEIIDSVIN